MRQPFVTAQYTLPAPVSGEVRLALVSDLHEHDPAPVIRRLAALKPDVIAVAGDTFERHTGTRNGERVLRGVPILRHHVGVGSNTYVAHTCRARVWRDGL